MASASAFIFYLGLQIITTHWFLLCLRYNFFLFFKSLQKFPSSWVGAVQEISYMLMSFLGLEFFMQNDAHHEWILVFIIVIFIFLFMFCFEDVYVIVWYGILKVTVFLLCILCFSKAWNYCATWQTLGVIWVSHVCLLSLTTLLLHSQLFHNPTGSSPSSKFHSELGHCPLHQCLAKLRLCTRKLQGW